MGYPPRVPIDINLTTKSHSFHFGHVPSRRRRCRAPLRTRVTRKVANFQLKKKKNNNDRTRDVEIKPIPRPVQGPLRTLRHSDTSPEPRFTGRSRTLRGFATRRTGVLTHKLRVHVCIYFYNYYYPYR